LKVLFVSIEFGPPFQRDLMTALASRGHEVFFYAAGLSSVSNRMKLRWTERNGIRRAELWNSGVKPAVSDDPLIQIGSAKIDRMTEAVLDTVKPDVVHVHELSGHGLSTLDVINRTGVARVASIHNFWPVCPQMNLVDAGGDLCLDDGGGSKCTRCRWLPAAAERTYVESAKSAFRATPLFKPLRHARRVLRHSIGRNASVEPVGWAARPSFTAEAFVRRREHAIAALNDMTLIHALSTRSAQVLEQRGVRPERIRVRPISLYGLDALRPDPRRAVSRPVMFGYRGALSYAKGVHILLSAFSRLDQKNARLLIYGAGEPEYERGLRAMAKSLNVEFRGEYRREDLSAINAGIDVGVVPSICNETFCLTGMEFLRCGVPVIATEIGGMVDYMRDSVNGRLVPPGDVAALAGAMQQLVDSPADIDALRSEVPSPSMDDVASSMIALYQEAAANA
jgi:glycosyltransferase involved in cell wall biosynthesis